MIVIHNGPAGGGGLSERSMTEALDNQPGILLVNTLVASGRRTREIDGIWIHPDGVFTIEAKGTRMAGQLAAHLNAPWTVDGVDVDFPSGPQPVTQARQAAQILRSTLDADGIDPGFITATVAVAGDHVRIDPTWLGSLRVMHTTDLSGLPAAGPAHQIGADDAAAIVAALCAQRDVPDGEALTRAGFQPGRAEVPAGGGRHGNPGTQAKRDDRTAKRRAALAETARREWRRSNRIRLGASLAALPIVVYLLTRIPGYCVVVGLVCAAAAAVWQLRRRRRLSGDRDRGVLSVALWAVTVAPFAAAGGAIAWLTSLPASPADVRPFVAMLGILAAAGMTAVIRSGRSAFIHPPRRVAERTDRHGNPTGSLYLTRDEPANAAASREPVNIG